jgi:hypothetical protein
MSLNGISPCQYCSIWNADNRTKAVSIAVASDRRVGDLAPHSTNEASPAAKRGSTSTKPRLPKLPPSCQSHQLAITYR